MGYGMTWGGDRLIYTGTGGTIVSVHPQGGDAQEVAKAGVWPESTRDGRTIMYSYLTKLWKADVDGGQPVAIAESGMQPSVTPDGRHVVFISMKGGSQSLWMVSTDGGESVRVSDRLAGGVDISPDGKSIAFQSLDAKNRSIQVVCALPSCGSPRILRFPRTGDSRLRWTPDGLALAMADATNANIWVHALDGGAPRQITHFTDGRTIVDFDWSPDGSRLAVARATTTSDIVVFRGFNR